MKKIIAVVLAVILAPCGVAQTAPPAAPGSSPNPVVISVPSMKNIVEMAYAIKRTYPRSYAAVSARAKSLAGAYYSKQRSLVNGTYPPEMRGTATMLYALEAFGDDPRQPARAKSEAGEILGFFGMAAGGLFGPEEIACQLAALNTGARSGRSCSN